MNPYAAVLEAARRLRPERAESSPAVLDPDGIGRLGRLTGGEIAQARRDGWTGIIDPMLSTLSAATATC